MSDDSRLFLVLSILIQWVSIKLLGCGFSCAESIRWLLTSQVPCPILPLAFGVIVYGTRHDVVERRFDSSRRPLFLTLRVDEMRMRLKARRGEKIGAKDGRLVIYLESIKEKCKVFADSGILVMDKDDLVLPVIETSDYEKISWVKSFTLTVGHTKANIRFQMIPANIPTSQFPRRQSSYPRRYRSVRRGSISRGTDA